MLPIQTVIKLDKFKPRHYQMPVMKAFDSGKYKKFLIVNPRRCLAGSSHIIMADGSWKFLKDITVGDKILSWDGSRFVPDTVKNFWCTGIKESKRVKSVLNPPIITSAEHRFASINPDSDGYKWKTIGETNDRRYLLQYSGNNYSSIHNPDMAEVWGYLLADGYVAHYQQPKFTNANMEILERVDSLLKSLFNVKIIWRKKGNAFDLGISNGTKGGGFTPNPVKEMFRKYGCDIPKSHRTLPSIIWNYDEKSLGRFFAALISSDGNIYLPAKGIVSDGVEVYPPGVEVTISAGCNYEYAWGIYWLLRKMGIIPQMPYKEKESNWKVKIGKREDIRRLFSYGPIYGKEEAQIRALERCSDIQRERNQKFGCYTSGFEKEDHNPEVLYDIETEIHHNFIANGYVVHNSGKDVEWWNIMIREAIEKTGNYFYCLPTYQQCRSVIWEGKINGGQSFLSFIPEELIKKINHSEMKIILHNDSMIKLVGSDNYDRSIIGSNPRMFVFSEYALADENAYKLAALPILKANDGIVALISTPRGKNHMYELFQIAKNSPDWFVQFLTVEDTGHISLQEIQKDIDSGEISADLAQQEYFCSFEQGQEGSYYAKYIDKMRLKGQIGIVDWEPYHKVFTAWDLGIKDPTVIIFFQCIGEMVRIIDYYEAADKPMNHFAQVIAQKQEEGWIFDRHFGPHDLMQRESARGLTKKELYAELGVKFTEPVVIGIDDGIEQVRRVLTKVWIDESRCKKLLKALENYREEFDPKRKVYKGRPFHDQYSHGADAMRYLAAAIPKTKQGMTAEKLDKLYNEAMYGAQSNMPAVFRDDLPDY